jgi:hypothetical protein
VNTDSGKSLKSVHLQPESLFTLNQNGCSRSSGMGVHDGPEYAVGSYDIPVAQGEVFVYRMRDPERLTISLEHQNDQWVVGEVRGYCNASPSPGALEIVRRWVAGLPDG